MGSVRFLSTPASPRPHAATGARRGRTPPPPLPPGTPTAPLWGRLAYDGTDYAGWQSQTARGGDSMARRPRTVQGEVEAALETVLRAPAVSLSLAAAGRTDAGVHAQGQVISLRAPLGVDASVARVNAVLPPDVRFTHLARAPPTSTRATPPSPRRTSTGSTWEPSPTR